ncbi:TolC family protein [Fimbriimonas ginsengisoli]|uniref:Outer membrane efflux protein n=1 Tax=Fimbriimonas ginsengisoli Gsoil 348 TaxID=661478 RepID=A0A068NSS3_FIMGI|nr:TolC family protein [Fimbriimonas ginsengisoli]AIE86553.1 outer membrane efflux protein [Fimbriimonas ginsengisoli Gsoil 348]
MAAVGVALMQLQTPAQAPSGPLTIDQAVAIAQQNAFAVRIQASNVEKSRQRVEETKGNMGPKVGLSATYTRFDQSQTAALGGGGSIVVSPLDQKVGGLAFSLPIDISGNLARTVQAADQSYRAAQQTLRATLNDTRLSARQAYFNVLRASALVGVQQQAVRDAQERLDQGRKLLAGEQVARVDVTRLEAQVAQAETDLITAQNSLQIAKYAFNQTLARPIETPVELVDITALPPLTANVDELVRTGQIERPEVQALVRTLRALGYTVRATEATLNPSLTLGVNYQRQIDAAGFSARPESTNAVLALSIPVFDSGVTRARVRQARQDEQQAKINLEQTELFISQDVRNAVQNLASAQARLRSAISQRQLAEEVFRLARVRQEAAEGTYVEVIDAETSLTQARNAEVGARYDYLVAYSQLQRAVGSDTLAASTASPTTAPQTTASTAGGAR